MTFSQVGPTRHRARKILLTVASVTLAAGLCPPRDARAQTAATASAGWHVPRGGRVVVPAATLRTPADMDRFAAEHPNLAAAARPGQAPLPTMAPDIYAAAKAAAEAQSAQRLLKPAIARPGQTDAAGIVHPLDSPATLKLNKPGPDESQPNNAGFPADVTGAIGPDQIVLLVNNSFNVYNRSGKLLKTTGLPAFLGTSDGISAPRVVYDPLWKRWVITASRIPAAGDTVDACFFLTVSSTGNPSGAWLNFGAVCQGGASFAAGDLWDFDQVGLTQDAILITGNLFSASNTYKGPVLAPLPKALVYNAQGFSFPDFLPGTQFGTLAPPIVQDSHAKAFFLAIDNASNTVLDLFAGTNLSNEFDATFTMQAQITVAAYTVPPAAPEPNTALKLDTLDSRFQQPSAQYANKLWNVHTENYSGFSAPHYFEIDTTANSIIQDALFYESSSSFDFNPSITANPGDDAFVTWTTVNADPANPKHQPAMRVSGRQAADDPGIGGGTLLGTSPAPIETNPTGAKLQLWGAYSNVALDPLASSTCAAGQRAAAFNEMVLDKSDWSSRFGIFGFCK